jgi:hypothetical protein
MSLPTFLRDTLGYILQPFTSEALGIQGTVAFYLVLVICPALLYRYITSSLSRQSSPVLSTHLKPMPDVRVSKILVHPIKVSALRNPLIS